VTGPASKLAWEGEILSVQPRIRLLRSFDERSHNYLGYILGIRRALGGEARKFVVALGKGASEKHRFRVGDRVLGAGEPVAGSRLETADIYKASGLKIIERADRAVRQAGQRCDACRTWLGRLFPGLTSRSHDGGLAPAHCGITEVVTRWPPAEAGAFLGEPPMASRLGSHRENRSRFGLRGRHGVPVQSLTWGHIVRGAP
jgi:hypothetical protein